MNITKIKNYVLENEYISPQELQILCYYIKVWTFIAGYEILDSEFKNKNGIPFNSSIIHAGNSIGKPAIMNTRLKDIVDMVLLVYGSKSLFSLRAMSTKELLDMGIGNNETINYIIIDSYYRQKNFAKNFNGTEVFYLLQDDDWASFVMDMNQYDKQRFSTYSSYEKYKKLILTARKEVSLFWDSLVE